MDCGLPGNAAECEAIGSGRSGAADNEGGNALMTRLTRRSFAVSAAALAAGAAIPARAQDRPVIKVSSLTLPVFNPLVWNVMKARGFDAKHGFSLDIHAYPSIAAFYAGFATGETDALIGGPTVFVKLAQQGVPVRIIGTGFTLADLVIFAKDPKIKSLADLKGKQLAIDMGGSQYQVVKIYCAAKGIDLGKDITVVNANFAVARAQLEAGRVDAALVIEPLASIIVKQHADWHSIFNGAVGWKEITGESGWEIVPAMRADSIKRVPKAPQMLLAALQDTAAEFEKNTAAADKIANETLKLPPGILTAAVDSKRLQMIVKPAWDPAVKKSITDMMERAVKAGFYDKVPDGNIIYAP
jgi:ABC-type nitrate/sulfonate/bicarbonate transport system substrate-binding protein